MDAFEQAWAEARAAADERRREMAVRIEAAELAADPMGRLAASRQDLPAVRAYQKARDTFIRRYADAVKPALVKSAHTSMIHARVSAVAALQVDDEASVRVARERIASLRSPVAAVDLALDRAFIAATMVAPQLATELQERATALRTEAA